MKPSHKQNPVIIIGGGMVGLSLALALSEAKIDVIVIEKNKPQLRWAKNSWDSRVSAINLAVHRFLQNLGIWPNLRPESYTSLKQMHVWDHLGGGAIDFNFKEIGVPELGFIVENREIIQTLWKKLQNQPNVAFYCPGTPEKIVVKQNEVELILKNSDSPENKKLIGQLIVGADGPESWVRQQMKIIVDERPYRHEALIGVIQSKQSHHQTALQSFLATGPLALLPLADLHHEAIVWSAEPYYVDYLLKLDPTSFNREITNAMESRLDQLTLVTELKKIPLHRRHAKNYVQERFALIGDAAHTIHPLAGQGVNLGFMDAACLAQSLIDAQQKKQDLGSLRPLRRYERWRKADNLMMLTVMQIFQELFSSQTIPIVQARNYGLNLTNRLSFIKKCLAYYAMGNSEDLPEIAK